MKTVLLFSLESINNAGDQILGVTTEWLVQQCGVYKTKRAQLMPELSTLPFKLRIPSLLWRPIKSFICRTGLYRNHTIYNLNYIIIQI